MSPTFPLTEFECKIILTPVTANKIISAIFAGIGTGRIELDDIAQRAELHLFFKHNNIHRAYIFSKGSTEVWIKEKSNGRVIPSPQRNIPILMRSEKKLKPSSPIYNKLFLETLKWTYVGSFQKESIDISFWFSGYLFTVTIAEAHTGWSEFWQIEIEYDSNSPRIKSPSKKMVLSLFDEIIPVLLPKPTASFTTETKLQWLTSNH